ncbi:MAG: DUF4293 domain-containing protein [Odoribacter sp.]|nr:DUF4293 domain-containing protein [Odoribacter sp.]
MFMALLYIMPVATLESSGVFFDFFTTKVVRISETSELVAWNYYSLALNLLITTLTVIIIFLYKKRFVQLRFCVVNIVLMLGLLILMWVQVQGRANDINAITQIKIAFGFPLVGIILTWLAIRGIIKDIALLKSYDRIR